MVLKLLRLALLAQLCGCAVTVSPLGIGLLSTNYVGPMAIEEPDTRGVQLKVGEACAVNVLGVVVSGDQGIVAAMLDADIRHVYLVEYQVNTFFTFYARRCTVVYGT